MGFGVKDILDILDHWSDWKKIKACPDRLDALEAKVAQLLASPLGKQCPSCFKPTFSLIEDKPKPGSLGRLGQRVHTYQCKTCSFSSEETVGMTSK
jgi:hypothetical protein